MEDLILEKSKQLKNYDWQQMDKSTDPPVKDRLLTSGAILFAEKGFGGVSVREICKHANTSMSMIHHYFENKDGLLKAIVEQFGSHVFAVPMRILDKAPRSEEDFLIRIEMLFESTLEAFIENRMVEIRFEINFEAIERHQLCPFITVLNANLFLDTDKALRCILLLDSGRLQKEYERARVRAEKNQEDVPSKNWIIDLLD